jgi:hypothetical protein
MVINELIIRTVGGAFPDRADGHAPGRFAGGNELRIRPSLQFAMSIGKPGGSFQYKDPSDHCTDQGPTWKPRQSTLSIMVNVCPGRRMPDILV